MTDKAFGAAPVSQDGLSQAEPSSTVSALTGFDPSRWHQFDGAPRDGTAFLATAPGYEWPEVVRWFDYSPEETEELEEPGYFHFADDLLRDVASEFDADELTHWMPLPPTIAMEVRPTSSPEATAPHTAPSSPRSESTSGDE